MFNEVLVPVDLNADGFSDKAVATACEIVRDGGKLHLLKVTPGYQMAIVGSFFPEESNQRYQTEAKESLEDFAQRAMKGRNISYTTHVQEGKAASEIIRYAESKEAEAIVMASHKRSKLDALMVGSIAMKVLGMSKIPVMVIKP